MTPLAVATLVALSASAAGRAAKPAATTKAAPPGANDVQRYLDSAAAFYEKLDFERALDQAHRAEGFSRGPDDDVQIALIEGILLASLAREDDADAAFRRGLGLKPDAKLPYTVSPKIEKKFESVRAEVTKVVGRRELPETSAPTPDLRPPAAEAEAGAGGTNLRPAGWVTGGIGALLLGGGTVSLLVAKGRYDGLTNGHITPTVALQYRNDGPTFQTAGWVMLTAGVLALGTAGILIGVSGAGDEAVEPAVMMGPNGGTVGIAGVFP